MAGRDSYTSPHSIFVRAANSPDLCRPGWRRRLRASPAAWTVPRSASYDWFKQKKTTPAETNGLTLTQESLSEPGGNQPNDDEYGGPLAATGKPTMMYDEQGCRVRHCCGAGALRKTDGGVFKLGALRKWRARLRGTQANKSVDERARFVRSENNNRRTQTNFVARKRVFFKTNRVSTA